MRLLFFIMLLVNVAGFAYFTFREQAATPSRPAQPALNAERIRLAGQEQKPADRSASEQLTCWTWSGFNAEQLGTVREELEKLALGKRLSQPANEEFWLYIPPLKNKQDAEKKLAELKARTIEGGVLLVERGKWQFAISFSSFATEDEATVHLNQLKEKGVKSAKIIKREVAGDSFLIQQVDANTADSLNKLQAQFSATVLKPVDCKLP